MPRGDGEGEYSEFQVTGMIEGFFWVWNFRSRVFYVAKYHLGKVKFEQMQPAVLLICSMWPLGWPSGVLQGFKVHCFTCAVLSADLCGSKASLLRIIADSCSLSSLPLLHFVTRVSIFSGKLFLLIFSVMVPVSGCSFGWFPYSRVAMDTSLQLWHLAPH